MAKRSLQDRAFQHWYGTHAKKLGLDPNPDNPLHHYDYRKAYRAGVKGPDKAGHWPSEFKKSTHPNLIVKGINTKTGERAKKK